MPDPRLLVLGAGRHQAALVRRAESSGVRTVAVDPYPDALGKRFSTWSEEADALDTDAMIEIARRYEVDGVTTVGTDQTVATMAQVADACGLPCHVRPVDAIAATDKATMRSVLTAVGVPMSKGQILGPDDPADLRGLHLPVVVKPTDSQGQRGTTKVFESGDLGAAVAGARAASRRKTVVIEEFAVGPEVTINAWVHQGTAVVLTVTDRITYNPMPVLGICLQHVHPSRHAPPTGEATGIAQAVADGYRMANGPLYIQAIVTDRGLIVMEAAARVGGGHEMSLVPLVVGVDLIDRSVELALGRPGSDPPAPDHRRAGLVNFIVARAGRIERLEPVDLSTIEGIEEGGWYHPAGFDQPPISNSLGRIGYFVALGGDRDELLDGASRAYAQLVAANADGTNLVFWPESAELLGG